MNEQVREEKARIEREAADAVTRRSPSSGADARQEALRRYLGAESYHEKKLEDAETETHESEDGS